MLQYHVNHFSFKHTSSLQQPFEAGAIITILIAHNKENKDVMTPFISKSWQYSVLSLVPPWNYLQQIFMMSHVPFGWACVIFQMALNSFWNREGCTLTFLWVHKTARCQGPTGLTRTMSGKEPDKKLPAESVLFSVNSHAAVVWYWGKQITSRHTPRNRSKPTPLAEQQPPPCAPHSSWAGCQHHTSRLPLNGGGAFTATADVGQCTAIHLPQSLGW